MGLDEGYIGRVVTLGLMALLLVLSFLIVRPFLYSLVTGLLLVFIFDPLSDWLKKFIKNKNISAGILSLILIILIIVPIILLIPLIFKEVTKIVLFSQSVDVIALLAEAFPSLFKSAEVFGGVRSVFDSFVRETTTNMLDSVSNLLLDFPLILAQLFVVLLTFFFVIRDKEKIIEGVKEVLPFPRIIREKIFKSTKDVTVSVIYGQIIIGLIEGAISTIGFFLFKVPNPVLFSILITLAGILPAIGPTIVWIPLAIYLFATGNVVSGVGIVVFGLITGLVTNILSPLIVSKRTKMNPLVILLAMVGGLLLFGILGLILGPLIIGYFLIFLDIYKNKKFLSVLIKEEQD
ncbi:MAG TPA: AI-2E family transporter [Candidatus Pacearchaeota archaeon]|nr:AI-2E family transporter [Candidatus Pacearchaeota archaeon]